MPGRTRALRRASAAAIAVVLAMIVVLSAGCGEEAGDAFVGDWTSEAMGDAVVTVTRDGGDFTIRLPNKTYEGQLEDDAVFAPLDDPTIVLEMKGDDLVMHFFKEDNALVMKRAE